MARIGAAHGTTGEVRLWPFTGDAGAVGRYGALEAADGRIIEIESLRPAKGFFIARIKGVTDRIGAERLRNVDLFVPRDRLPPPAPDEYYYADLIGLVAEDLEGGPLGTVIAVHDFGAGDLLEIVPQGGGETQAAAFHRGGGAAGRYRRRADRPRSARRDRGGCLGNRSPASG